MGNSSSPQGGMPGTVADTQLAGSHGGKGNTQGKIVAAIAAGALLIGGIFYVLNKSNGTNTASGVGGDAGASESAPLDIYKTDITHEDYGRQLDVTLPYLQAHRAQSTQEASDELDLENRVNTLKSTELPKDPALLNAQQDQNDITADLWTISKETNTTLARNLLTAVFWNDPDNDNDAYDLHAKQIGNGKGKILEPTSVMEVSPLLTSGVLGGVKIDGQASYLAQVASRSENRIYEEVLSRRYSQDGKSSKPIVVQTIQYGDPLFVLHPSQVTSGK